MRTAGVIVACAMATGCAVGNPEEDLEQMSLGWAESYQGMAKINARPYVSGLGSSSINCFVAGDVTNYKQIHPERMSANVAVARGTVIVREVLDGAGRVTKLTLMAKGPAGYDPSLGDWWFAVTDPRGVPLVENGVVQAGRLTQCHDCHDDRTRDDFLFGVPSSNM
jgi:hypothetical protein